MVNRRESFKEEQTSWTWHVMPLLIVAAAASALFMPQRGARDDAAAADIASAEASPMYSLLTPSPEPGQGEPAPDTHLTHTY